jgi:LysR family transcriptional regulator, glycine cleavage system transcriptional activator
MQLLSLLMATRRRDLPPMPALLAFEAAGRLSNFSAAARELGATQPAVSHQIAALEARLGTALFRRLHRGVALTAEGERLLQVVTRSLDAIADTAAEIRQARDPGGLTVATDFAFATYWLLPRLERLRTALGGVEIRILASQDVIDPRDRAVDAVVAFGPGRWPGCTVDRLFPESVVPICSPAMLARLPRLAAPADLLAQPLLHLESPDPARWLDWPGWFRGQGVEGVARGRSLRLNNYPLVLQAALAGQGVALGWRPLVDDLLAAGQLVACLPHPFRTQRGYFLAQPLADRPDPLRAAFRDWLVAEAAGGRP